MALSLGEDRGQESYPLGRVSRGGDRARRLRFKDGDGGNGAAATGPAACLCPGTSAGAVCRAGAGAEAVCLEAEAGPSRAAPRTQDDNHNDDGTSPVSRRSVV